jgi:hypothetical protein
MTRFSPLRATLFSRALIGPKRRRYLRRLSLQNLEDRITPDGPGIGGPFPPGGGGNLLVSFQTSNSTIDPEGTGTGGTQNVVVVLNQSTFETVTVQVTSSSGTATSGNDFTAVNQTLTFNAFETSKTVQVQAVGDSAAEFTEAFTLTLSNPTGASLGLSTHSVAIVDDDSSPSLPAVAFVKDSVTVNEAAGTVSVGVQISHLPTSNVTVQYSTADGTATAGSDYTGASPTTLTFTPTGPLSQTVTIPITDDAKDENNETFTINLSNPSGLTIVSPSTCTVTIVDNDPTSSGSVPYVFVGSSFYSVGEAGPTVTVEVKLSSALSTGQTATVNYATVDGTATGGLDYTGAFGTLQFDSTSQTRTVTIPILSDTEIEGNEQFKFSLSNPSGANLGIPSQADITIIDDDFPVAGQAVVQFETSFVDVFENVGQATLTIRRSGYTASQVSVSYSTADLTAVAPGDYTSVGGGVVTFASGETIKTINITIVNDGTPELMERLKVTLSNPTTNSGTVVLGQANTAVISILDDDIRVSPMPEPEEDPCCCCHIALDLIANPPKAEGRNEENETENPIRFQDGTVNLSEKDLTSIIMDAPWGHARCAL